MTHTPGPWKLGEVDDLLEGFNIIAPVEGDPKNPMFIATVVGGLDESDGNARLIAALPDLLEALELARLALIKSSNFISITLKDQSFPETVIWPVMTRLYRALEKAGMP